MDRRRALASAVAPWAAAAWNCLRRVTSLRVAVDALLLGLHRLRAARREDAVEDLPAVRPDDDSPPRPPDDDSPPRPPDDDSPPPPPDDDSHQPPAVVPLSVNYHFTRQCNYSCGFCFHTAKTSFVLPLPEAKRGLAMLAAAGMKKLNFSGGEPFIVDGGRYMGELIRYCKTELAAAGVCVSIVTNGSLVRESWMRRYGEHVDVLAVSCDSFDADTNRAIGRRQGARPAGRHADKVYELREWCARHRVAFKVNTVVNACNVHELFAEHIARLRPARWKVFQCLALDGENAGPGALRDAERFRVTDEQFDGFLRRHAAVRAVMVPEGNGAMRDSYLILDEYMRFLDCRDGGKRPSASLLDVGVDRALRDSGFDERAFRDRGGVYEWDKRRLLRLQDDRLEW